jgi:hypothetical protein
MAGQTGSSEQRCVLSTLGYQEYYSWCGNSKDENGISWVARHGTKKVCWPAGGEGRKEATTARGRGGGMGEDEGR